MNAAWLGWARHGAAWRGKARPFGVLQRENTMTRETVLRIAAAAQCDPRTVATWASGGNVRPLLRERIEAAVKALRVKR